MRSTNLFVYLMAVAVLLILSAPQAESSILIFLCLVRSPYCPFRTTTTTTTTTPATAAGDGGM